jgi:hypothetical protein
MGPFRGRNRFHPRLESIRFDLRMGACSQLKGTVSVAERDPSRRGKGPFSPRKGTVLAAERDPSRCGKGWFPSPTPSLSNFGRDPRGDWIAPLRRLKPFGSACAWNGFGSRMGPFRRSQRMHSPDGTLPAHRGRSQFGTCIVTNASPQGRHLTSPGREPGVHSPTHTPTASAGATRGRAAIPSYRIPSNRRQL